MPLLLNKKTKLLFACLDWRLHPQIEEYFAKNNKCDCCITAGSIKGLIEENSRQFFGSNCGFKKTSRLPGSNFNCAS